VRALLSLRRSRFFLPRSLSAVRGCSTCSCASSRTVHGRGQERVGGARRTQVERASPDPNRQRARAFLRQRAPRANVIDFLISSGHKLPAVRERAPEESARSAHKASRASSARCGKAERQRCARRAAAFDCDRHESEQKAH